MMLASRRVTRFKVLNRPLIEARGLDLRDLKQENEHEERATPSETTRGARDHTPY
jgi:hypothetical protein